MDAILFIKNFQAFTLVSYFTYSSLIKIFTFQLAVVSDPGKSYFEKLEHRVIASVVSRSYQFFIYLGLDVQRRFPYRSQT